MRPILLLAVTLGVFGTGCGGCADDKGAPPSSSTPTMNAPTHKTTHVRVQFDAGPSLDDPAAGDH